VSKGNYQTRPAINVSTPVEKQAANRTESPTVRRDVDKHRQCPLCYMGILNGVGHANGGYAKSATLSIRYYKCDKCGHTWSVSFKPEEILQIKEIFSENDS
jgi:hypothetical protein